MDNGLSNIFKLKATSLHVSNRMVTGQSSWLSKEIILLTETQPEATLCISSYCVGLLRSMKVRKWVNEKVGGKSPPGLSRTCQAQGHPMTNWAVTQKAKEGASRA